MRALRHFTIPRMLNVDSALMEKRSALVRTETKKSQARSTTQAQLVAQGLIAKADPLQLQQPKV
jgi:hypothetical protein